MIVIEAKINDPYEQYSPVYISKNFNGCIKVAIVLMDLSMPALSISFVFNSSKDRHVHILHGMASADTIA